MRTSRQTDVNSCSRATPNRMRFVFAARQTKVRSPQAPPKMTAVAANPATLPRADLSRWPVSINQSVIISAPLEFGEIRLDGDKRWSAASCPIGWWRRGGQYKRSTGRESCPKQTGLSGFVSVGCWHTRAAFISERPDPVGIVAAISQQHGSRLVTSWQMLVRLNRTHRRLFRLPCASYAL